MAVLKEGTYNAKVTEVTRKMSTKGRRMAVLVWEDTKTKGLVNTYLVEGFPKKAELCCMAFGLPSGSKAEQFLGKEATIVVDKQLDKDGQPKLNDKGYPFVEIVNILPLGSITVTNPALDNDDIGF